MALERALETEGVDSRADLSRLLGCSRGNITKLLVENHNFKIHTLADIFLALGFAFRPRVTRHPDTLWSPIVEPEEVNESEVTEQSTCTTKLYKILRDHYGQYRAAYEGVSASEGHWDHWFSDGTGGTYDFRFEAGRTDELVRQSSADRT